MIYAASRSIFTESAASKDCATFPESSHEFENDLCVSRFWTLLVGGGIFLGTVIAITVLGGLEYLQALFALPQQGGGQRAQAAGARPDHARHRARQLAGRPFRSSAEPFFNPKFKAKPKTANEFLYGGTRSTRRPRTGEEGVTRASRAHSTTRLRRLWGEGGGVGGRWVGWVGWGVLCPGHASGALAAFQQQCARVSVGVGVVGCGRGAWWVCVPCHSGELGTSRF